MRLSIVMPNYNGAFWLKECLPALFASSFKDFKLIIVDNGSQDESYNISQKFKLNIHWVQLDTNRGFAKAANIGIKHSKTPYTLLLNNDTIVEPDFLSNLVRKMDSTDEMTAAIQPMMLQMDNTTIVDDVGDSFSWYGIASKIGNGESSNLFKEDHFFFSPSGGATLYRTEFLKNLGGFDESFTSYLEDVDLGFRGRHLAYTYQYCPAARVAHKSHGSSIPQSEYVRLMTKNRLLLFLKNVPRKLLWKNAHRLIYSQVFHFIAYARPVASWKGYYDFYKVFSRSYKERKIILSNSKLSNRDIESLLIKPFPKPHLHQLVIDLIYNLFRRTFKK